MEIYYKGHSKNSGIYRIINTMSNRFYIGSCKRFSQRALQHRKTLEKNTHTNPFMLADFNKCGTEAFRFEVLEVVEGTKDIRIQKEQEYLDLFHDKQKMCYNIESSSKTNEGRIFSRDPTNTKKKISEALSGSKNFWFGKTGSQHPAYGRVVSKETRKKTSDSLQGKPSVNKGRKHSEETKKRISEAKKGKSNANKGKSKPGQSGKNHPMFGKTHKPENIEKMSNHWFPVGVSHPYYGKTGAGHPSAKKYINTRLISPVGIMYKDIDCLSSFARANGLLETHLRNVINGKRKSHKGWTIAGVE